MQLSIQAKKAIKSEIHGFVDSVIKRRVQEPFKIAEEELSRPFHTALLPEEILKSSKFERSFVTSLGQIGWEHIAKHVAEGKGYQAENSHKVSGEIYEGQLKVIQTILDELEHPSATGRRVPDWSRETKEILGAKAGSKQKIQVISDLYVKKKDGKEIFFEIKSSKPNSDQTKVSKEKMLKLFAMKHSESPGVFFALPDNPFITRAKYAWPHPMRWFDMQTSPVVLIGKDFWDTLGGKGTYEELLAIFREVGKVTKKRIRTEYLKTNSKS